MSSSLIETAHDDDLDAYIAEMEAFGPASEHYAAPRRASRDGIPKGVPRRTDNAYLMRNSNDRLNVSVTVSTAVQVLEPRGHAASTREEV